ncbi:MAG: hypothetical protein RR993_04095 [Clostridia bacterium]
MKTNKKIGIAVLVVLAICIVGFAIFAIVQSILFEPDAPITAYESAWAIDIPDDIKVLYHGEKSNTTVSDDRYTVVKCKDIRNEFFADFVSGNEEFKQDFRQAFHKDVYKMDIDFQPTWQNYKCKLLTSGNDKLFLILEGNTNRLIVFERKAE